MRCVIAWLLIMLLSIGARAQPGPLIDVGSGNAGTTTTLSVTTTAAVPLGALIIVVVNDGDPPNIGSVADAAGDTFLLAQSCQSPNSPSGYGELEIFYAYNAAGMAANSTVTYTSPSTNYIAMDVTYATNMNGTARVFDAGSCGSGTGTVQASGSVTPLAANDLFVGSSVSQYYPTTFTQSSGFSTPPNAALYQTTIGGNLTESGTTAQNYAPTASVSAAYASVLVAFESAGSTPPLDPRTMTGGYLLPSGALKTAGNQIVSGSGVNVRMSCTFYNEPTGNYSSDMNIISNQQGFNCVRYPYYDKTTCPVGVCNFTTTDAIVAAATSYGVKVIFDHQGNEGVNGTNNCLSQQANGLWFDSGSGTNNTDGCADAGTVTYNQFKANWLAFATHYQGNTTVIGYDLHNEPTTYGNSNCCGGLAGANWGNGGAGDMRCMVEDVGTSILAIDPTKLIVVEGIINNGNLFSGLVRGTTTYPSTYLPMDLSTIMALPPACCTNQLVYSVHDYPTDISGSSPDSGSVKIGLLNQAFGYLVSANYAPVWQGELGASLDNTNGNLADEQAWASMWISYLNGQLGSAGGPTFTGCQQSMGIDWTGFGTNAAQSPDGTLLANGTNNPGQYAVYSVLEYTPCSPPPTVTTWNPNDQSGMTISAGNLVATSNTGGGPTAIGESAAGTTVPPTPNIRASGTPGTEGAGNVIAITSGGKVSYNGVTFAITQGVTELYYTGGGPAAAGAQLHAAYQLGNGTWYGPITATSSGTGTAFGSPIPTGTQFASSVRTTTSQTTGKFCFGVVASTISNNWSVGIANASYVLSAPTALGGDSNSLGFDPNRPGAQQGIFFNAATLASGTQTSPSTEEEDICVDLGTNLSWSTNATMRAGPPTLDPWSSAFSSAFGGLVSLPDPFTSQFTAVFGSGLGSQTSAYTWNDSTTANPATETGGLPFTGLICPCYITFNELDLGGVATLNATGPFAIATPAGFTTWQSSPTSSTGHPFILILGQNHPANDNQIRIDLTRKAS